MDIIVAFAGVTIAFAGSCIGAGIVFLLLEYAYS